MVASYRLSILIADPLLLYLQDAIYQKLWGRFNEKTGLVETLDEDVEVVVPPNPSGVDDGGTQLKHLPINSFACTSLADKDNAHGITGTFTAMKATKFGVS